MRSVTYGGSVTSQARHPLKWFPFGSPDLLSNSTMPDPGLDVSGSSMGECFQGKCFLFPPTDRWAPGAEDLVPDTNLFSTLSFKP